MSSGTGGARQTIQRWQLLALLLLPPLLVALLLYWPTLKLPLVYDTILHTQLADDLNWLTVWRPSEKFGFYRPLVFAPLLLIQQLFHSYPAPLLHALNIAQHALNALLLTWLIWRLWPDFRLALTTGLLFASYPFTYQATIVYGNNAYLMVTGVILLGLHAYVGIVSSAEGGVNSGEFPVFSFQYAVRQLTRPTVQYLLLTLLFFFLGTLIHETIILLIPLCFLLAFIQQSLIPNPQSPILSFILHPSSLILISAALLYLLIYFFLPRGSGPLLDYGGNDLWPKLLILLQSAAYPFVWFAHLLPWMSAQVLVVGGFGLTAAGSLAVVWLRPDLGRPLRLGWSWWLLSSALIGLTLPTYYIADGARLLYLGGVGVALIWATMLTAFFSAAPTRHYWLREGIATLLLFFILVSSMRFVRQIIDNYAVASEPLQTIAQVMAQTPTDTSAEEALVMVNFPQWVSPPRNSYAAGNEWSPIMGDHLFMYELLRVNLGREYKVFNLTMPSLLSDTPYNYGVIGARTVERVPIEADIGRYHVFISRYEESKITTIYTGQIVQDNAPAVEQLPLATIDPYHILDATAHLCGSAVYTTLTLTPLQNPRSKIPTLSLFVQLLASDGRLLAQADGPPLGLAPEQIESHIGTQLIDLRTLPFSEGEAGQLLVGLYDYSTGERFAAVDGNGQPLADNALRIELSGCEEETTVSD